MKRRLHAEVVIPALAVAIAAAQWPRYAIELVALYAALRSAGAQRLAVGAAVVSVVLAIYAHDALRHGGVAAAPTPSHQHHGP
jgi:hypothetical protein